MALSKKDTRSAIRAYIHNAKTAGPHTITPPTASEVFSSGWMDVTDYDKIVGICFMSGSAADTASLHNVEITNFASGDKFYITGSDATIYTYSASLNTTASLVQPITHVGLGNKFYITGSGRITVYSASTSATASLVKPITAVAIGNKFYITNYDGTIYTFSASANTTASLVKPITALTQGNKFSITGSSGVIYTFSASSNTTASLVKPITAVAVGDKFSITGSSGIIYAYSASWGSTSSLAASITKITHKDRLYISGSTGTVYTYSASANPVPTDLGNIFYFATGSNLANSITNLQNEINTTSCSLFLTASAGTTALFLYSIYTGSLWNNLSFISGSTKSSFTNGGNVPPDTAYIYYFNTSTTLNGSVSNLRKEINASPMNTILTASVLTNTLRLWALNTGSVQNNIKFQSGSTRTNLAGGYWIPPDYTPGGGYVYYFAKGSSLANSVFSLRNKIDDSDINTVLTASTIGSTLRLWALNTGSVQNSIRFQSGSTRNNLAGGYWIPPDIGNIYYFARGSNLANSVLNLRNKIDDSDMNTVLTASVLSSTLRLWSLSTGSVYNHIIFRSGSTSNNLAGGYWILPDVGNWLYYFSIGTTLATGIDNLRYEINNSAINTLITASDDNTTLYMYTVNTGSDKNAIGFKSGSTQNKFTGGSWILSDTANVFYFGVGGDLSASCANLNNEINNSTPVNTFLDSTVSASIFNFYAIDTGIAGDSMGFQSGSTQYILSRALSAVGAGPGGTIYIDQTSYISSVDTSSAIPVTDNLGKTFSQDLYTTYMRLRYAQTGSTSAYTFRLVTYYTP